MIRLLLLLLAFTLSGCVKSAPVKIGYLATLSGKNSELGIGGRTGIRIAVEEWNKKGGIGGREIELITADDKSSVEGGLAALDSLQKQGVEIVIGPMTSNMKPVVDSGMARGILFVSPTISSSELSVKDDLFVRLIPTTVEQSELIVKEVLRRDLKNVLVYIDEKNLLYSSDIWKWIKTFAEEAGAQDRFRMEELRLKDPNRAEQLRQTADSLKPDGIVIIANGIDFGISAQYLRKSSAQFTLIGPRWASTPDLLINGGSAVENVLLTANLISENKTGEEKIFSDKFVKIQGQTPSFIPMFSHDAAVVLFTSLAKCKGKTDPAVVRDMIISSAVFKCVQGVVQIDSLGDAHRENIELLTVKNGKIVRWSENN